LLEGVGKKTNMPHAYRDDNYRDRNDRYRDDRGRNRSNRPPDRQPGRSPNRPSSRPAQKPVKKPLPMKTPASGKECRKMIKAAAWRISKTLHLLAAAVIASPDPIRLVLSALPPRHKERGDMIRLAAKLVRLKNWKPPHEKTNSSVR
jgi:hypothetical protein